MNLSPRNVAMDYLSRREHSRSELHNKLKSKGFEQEAIAIALNKLEAENLLNDFRFAQAYLRHRVSKGFGLIKIRHELNTKGVDRDILQQAEATTECDWQDHLETVSARKYGSSKPFSLKEKQKRIRFLQQRGFVMSDIMRLFA